MTNEALRGRNFHTHPESWTSHSAPQRRPHWPGVIRLVHRIKPASRGSNGLVSLPMLGDKFCSHESSTGTTPHFREDPGTGVVAFTITGNGVYGDVSVVRAFHCVRHPNLQMSSHPTSSVYNKYHCSIAVTGTFVGIGIRTSSYTVHGEGNSSTPPE